MGMVFVAEIFPGMPVVVFPPVFWFIRIDIRGFYEINAGCMVTEKRVPVKRANVITIISTGSTAVAVIAGIIKVPVSRPHRFFRMAFGLRDSALSLGFATFKFGFFSS